MPESNSPLKAGMVVAGTYDVERLLGKGGMGEVWLARHQRLAGKQVAIKVLHALGANVNAELLARFQREAEIAARLAHPNIVQVLDFNQLPTGEPFLVMEYLKGESLADRARAQGGSMSSDSVQAIVLQVGSALQAAHAAGVVHRDLKPDNIFLVPTALGDQVKVLDFGISKRAEAGAVATTELTLLGTPLYMSPEQALGHNRETNAQSDLFSLGSICYELLAGTAPFTADSIAQVVFRIAYQPHVPLKQVAPSLPDHVVNAVEHALVKDRSMRTPDIGTFIRELTGQTLGGSAPKTGEGHESSGVYSPGMRLTDSLLMSATVAPSSVKVLVPAQTPKSRSVLPLVAVGVVVLLIAGGVAFTFTSTSRTSGAQGQLAVQAQAQAQAQVPTPSPPPPPPVVLDAAVAQVDPAVVDAGAPAVALVKVPAQKPKKVEGALTEDERRIVSELNELIAAQQWEKVTESRRAATTATTTAAGRREVWLRTLQGECALHSLSNANGDYRRLQALNEPAALQRAIQVCRQYLPEFSP